MRADLIQAAQAAIANRMLGDDVMSSRSSAKRLASMASAGLRNAVMPAALVLAALGASGVGVKANAQSYGWNDQFSQPGVATVQMTPQQLRAYEDMQRRAAEQQRREQRNREAEQRRADEQTARIVGDAIANVAGQVVHQSGGNYSQAQSARDLGRMGTQAAMGTAGTNTAQKVAIGALAGSALSGIFGKDSKNAGLKAAVGAAIGAGAGYAWDKMNAPASQPAPAAYQPAAQMRVQVVEQVPVAAQAQPRFAAASFQGVHTAIAEAAKSRNLGFSQPGVRPIPATIEQLKEPGGYLIEAAIDSMTKITQDLGERTAMMARLQELRNSGANQIEVGTKARQLVGIEQSLRGHIGQTIEHINAAATQGGYDTRGMINGLNNLVTNGYVQDAQIALANRHQAGYAPR